MLFTPIIWTDMHEKTVKTQKQFVQCVHYLPFSKNILTLCMLGKNSADAILKYFSYFSEKIGYDTSCKLSPKETICMKCQILFSRKN